MENKTITGGNGYGSLPSMEGFNALKLSLIGSNLSHLMGQVLTVIDASTEGEKNKAMKDLVKKAFSDKSDWIRNLAWKEREDVGSAHGPGEDWEYGLVPFDDTKMYSFKV